MTMVFAQYACKFARITGLALLFCCFALEVANAAVPVVLKGEQTPKYGRIFVEWPEDETGEDLTLNTEIRNGVLIIRFSKAFTGQTAPLLADLKTMIALARTDPDEHTIRMALKGKYSASTARSYNVFTIDLLQPDSDFIPPKFVSEQEKRENQRLAQQKQAALQQAAKASKAEKPGPALPLKVRASQASDYTRIAFDWTGPVQNTLVKNGTEVHVTFDKPAIPDLTPVKQNAFRGLVDASSHAEDGKTKVKFDLAPGFDARLWQNGNTVLVDLFETEQKPQISDAEAKAAKPDAAAPQAKPMAATDADFKPATEHNETFPDNIGAKNTAEDIAQQGQEKTTARADPTPAGGIVRAKIQRAGTDLHMTFTFAAPVGSAAFKRADTFWILFDDNARIDIAELRRNAGQHIRSSNAFNTALAGGVRFSLPPSTQVEAQAREGGARWMFIFSEKLKNNPKALKLHREADGSGPGKLIADLPNVTAIHTIKDPVIGDTLSIATALGPVTGVQSMQRFVEVSVLPSSQGLAFEINADDLRFETRKDQVVVQTENGLSLTPLARPASINANNRATSSVPLPSFNATPGFIDFKNWAAPAEEHGFNAAYDTLLRKVAAAETDPQVRIDTARFLIANDLAPEALGMLSLARQLDPLLVQDPQFRALRGTASLLMGRIKEARADFAAQTLNSDPSAALWRGLLAAEMEDWALARREFDSGRAAFYLQSPEWQVRFRNAYARSALALNDLGAAKRQLDEARAIDVEEAVKLRTRMISAAYAKATGNDEEAIRLYQTVIDAQYEPLEARAIFEISRIQMQTGALTADEVTDRLENLLYRWRGDNLELEETLALGRIYSEKGDYRRALKAMNSAVTRFPNSPVTRRISDDMNKIFKDLFLNGGADAMDPVQALALFYQFIDLVPIGTEGDRMLRMLADRLIDFDLLPQATELLQHQVDNRIRNGQAKAQIAVKLALIYLLDHKPEKALEAIRKTRLAQLPKALNQERRLIEARALAVLGRADHALELLETDRTPQAAILRADIAWQTKEWPVAAPLMLSTVQRYISPDAALSEDHASLILRTAIALSLNHNRDGLNTLANQYTSAIENTAEGEIFALVTRQENLGDIPVKDLAPVLARTENLREVLKKYQMRFKTPPADSANTQSPASGVL